MKKLRLALLTGLTVVVLAAALDVTGKWEVEATFDDGSISGGGFDCAFKQDGERLTGNCSGGTAQLTGEVKGQSISWRLQSGGNTPSVTTSFTGTLDEAGTNMKGRFTVADKGGRFTASKQQ
jgi:hypothetical protein